MKLLAIAAISLYQKTLSPDHGWFSYKYPGGYCRFHPTCSHYAKESIMEHGLIVGGFLAIARVSRCHPLTAPGHDPVLNHNHN